jgi:cell division septation protein DedD
LKETQIPKKKTQSYFKMGLGFVALVGLIIIAAAVVKSLETSKIPETGNRMVSFRIIDVPYKGQILKKDKGERAENYTSNVRQKDDSLPVQAVEAAVSLEEHFKSNKIPPVADTVSENESPKKPTKLKDKFVAMVKSWDDVSVKAKAAAAEVPELGNQEPTKQPLNAKIVIEEPVFAKKALFTVQVGVFRNEAYAHRKAAKLEQLDYPSFIQKIVGKDQKPLYLVCFGRFLTRKEVVLAMTAFIEKENMDAVVASLKSQ